MYVAAAIIIEGTVKIRKKAFKSHKKRTYKKIVSPAG